MFALQVNFDSMGKCADVRFGLDSGAIVAFGFGLEVSLKMGLIYVFN